MVPMTCFRAQTIHHFDLVKGDHGATSGATGNVADRIRLQRHLHFGMPIQDGNLEVHAWVRHAIQQSSAPPIGRPHIQSQWCENDRRPRPTNTDKTTNRAWISDVMSVN